MLSNGRECKCKTAKIDIHIKGAKVPGNESSIELSFPGAKRPGYERARERIGQGAKGPGSELARVLLADSLRGANWPGSEKARYPLHTALHAIHAFTVFTPYQLVKFMGAQTFRRQDVSPTRRFADRRLADTLFDPEMFRRRWSDVSPTHFGRFADNPSDVSPTRITLYT